MIRRIFCNTRRTTLSGTTQNKSRHSSYYTPSHSPRRGSSRGGGVFDNLGGEWEKEGMGGGLEGEVGGAAWGCCGEVVYPCSLMCFFVPIVCSFPVFFSSSSNSPHATYCTKANQRTYSHRVRPSIHTMHIPIG